MRERVPQANFTLALALTFIPTFNIRNKLPHTKDTAKGYNYRMFTIFLHHPHVYDFVRRLKDEDEYQYHKLKESQVQIKKRQKCYDKIDEKLLELFKEYENDPLTPTELAIKSVKK
jgi:hypothetical protein